MSWNHLWKFRGSQSQTAAKAAQRARRKLPSAWRTLHLEQLEDPLCPRAFSEPFTTLAGVLDGVPAVQTTLDTALNTASKIPLLTQGGSGVLGTINDVHAINNSIDTAAVKSALNDAANSTDALMTTAL